MGDAGFEHGTSATEVWCAANKQPHRLSFKEDLCYKNIGIELGLDCHVHFLIFCTFGVPVFESDNATLKAWCFIIRVFF